MLNYIDIISFQFLDGAIKSDYYHEMRIVDPKFQFLDGAIKRPDDRLNPKRVIIFQFLDGAIKRTKPPTTSTLFRYFNSLMVRLKEQKQNQGRRRF